jgi:hypothetical protein
MRNWPVYLLVALGMLGALLMFLSEAEPVPTARDMAQAICPTPGAPLGRDLLERHLAERVDFALADEDPITLERAELLERLSRLRATYPSCSLDLVDLEVSTGEADGSLRLRGAIEYSESEASDLHAARRAFDASFRAAGKISRLERIDLGALRRPPPEARP